MNVAHLLVALGVEVGQFLPSAGAHGLLIKRAKRLPTLLANGGHLVCDAVALVDALGLVGGMVLLVEGGDGVSEASGDTVLVVKGDGLLDRAVGEYVPVRQVLGDDAGSRLVFLSQFVGSVLNDAGNIFGGGGGDGGEGGGSGDVDLGGAELGAVKEEGGLGGAGGC